MAMWLLIRGNKGTSQTIFLFKSKLEALWGHMQRPRKLRVDNLNPQRLLLKLNAKLVKLF
jgi:hypothetical protein